MNFKSKYLAIKVSNGLRYIAFGLNIIVIILLFLSAKAQTIPPSESILIAFLGMGYPILLFLNILFLLLWIVFLRWKYIIVSIVCLCFAWNSISTYIPMHSPQKDIPDDCIKFLTYNVDGFGGLTGEDARSNPIFKYLANSGADIICMQEFIVARNNIKDGNISLEEVDNMMEVYPYRTVIPLDDSTDSPLIYGLACYSKYPIMRVARVPLPTNYNSGSAMYELRVGRKFVTVINNYLESNRLTADDKKLYKEFIVNKDKDKLTEVAISIQEHLAPSFFMRERQANALVANIKEHRPNTHAIIVCGDFNSPPMSYTYSAIKGNMADAFKDNGCGMGITFYGDGFLFRIDYIMHTKNIHSYACWVDKVKYSDHYPLYASLLLDYI